MRVKITSTSGSINDSAEWTAQEIIDYIKEWNCNFIVGTPDDDNCDCDCDIEIRHYDYY